MVIGLVGFAGSPGLLYALPEILVVIVYIALIEVVEHWKSCIGGDVILPLLGETDGVEHLGEVLRMLKVVTQLGGQGIIGFVAAFVFPNVL